MIVTDAAPMISDKTRSLANVGGGTGVTVSFHASVVASAASQMLFELTPDANSRNGCRCYVGASGGVVTATAPGGAYNGGTFPFPTGAHAWTFRFDRTKNPAFSVWVDGASQGVTQAFFASMPGVFETNRMYIAHRGSGSGFDFVSGTMMSVPRVWNQALTDEQCRRLSIGW